MFEDVDTSPTGLQTLADLVDQVVRLAVPADDAERIDQLGLLERIKSVAAGLQVRTTVAFAESQRQEQLARGVPAKEVGRGIASQVGLARRDSLARSARLASWSQVLVEDLPHTLAVLERGDTSEWRAMIVARETKWLSSADRAIVDREIAEQLPGLGDREVEDQARGLAYKQDPAGFVARSRNAERDRRVGIRPAPDTMTRLTALLPVVQGVAAYAALVKAADSARAAGDGRGRGQVMADTLVERVTGQAVATGVPVEVELVLTDRTLVGGDEPAHMVGHGPISADLARAVIGNAPIHQAWVRRLVTDPVTGHLAAMDTHRRIFPELVRLALTIRDLSCRTPWCGAPIRHSDHAQPFADGGPTSFENGQGLCEACNYAKQAPGWTSNPAPEGTSHAVSIITPTGHRYTSRPPDLPGSRRRQRAAAFDDVLEALGTGRSAAA